MDSDAGRLHIAKQELLSLMKEETLCGVSFCILANKQDLPHALSTKDLIMVLGIPELEAAGYKSTVIAAVANKGVGVDQALEWLSRNARVL